MKTFGEWFEENVQYGPMFPAIAIDIASRAWHARDAEIEELTTIKGGVCPICRVDMNKAADRLAEVTELKEKIERLTEVCQEAIKDAEKCVNPGTRLFNYDEIKAALEGKE